MTVYTGRLLGSLSKSGLDTTEMCAAVKGEFAAHGRTVKEAMRDVVFKEQAEKVRNEPIKPSQMISVEHFRAITGACQAGCDMWRECNGVKGTRMRADKLAEILKKTDAYGWQKFQDLLEVAQ